MRINIYGPELTTRVEWVSKTVTGGPAAGEILYGIRLYLDSPSSLHHGSQDDDTSAVTLWVPWTKERGHNFDYIKLLLARMSQTLTDAAATAEARS